MFYHLFTETHHASCSSLFGSYQLYHQFFVYSLKPFKMRELCSNRVDFAGVENTFRQFVISNDTVSLISGNDDLI